MKNQVKTLEEESQKLTKEKQDHENKVKVLVKEVISFYKPSFSKL